MDNAVLRFLRLVLVEQWPITLAAALGFVAVYVLLPRPRLTPRTGGIAAAGLALLVAGFFIVRATGFSAEVILFYAFSAIAILAGGLLVTQSNPARAALAFALVVLSTCGLFLLQAAPFLMAATTIIYAGAIIVTFLFVLMLAQQEGLSDADQRSREPVLSSLTGFVLLGALLYVLSATYGTGEIDERLAQLRQARHKATVKEMAAELGDARDGFGAFFDPFRRAILKSGDSPQARALIKDVDDQQFRWVQDVLPRDNPDEARGLLERLEEIGRRARASYGELQPPADTPLSPFSGPSPGSALFAPLAPAAGDAAVLRRDPRNRPELPDENTAYLGRSLFTDYLLAVELGGTLLLVATIGAIAIAARRRGVNP
jgi:NADH:ubiquinone oxidoreductase subunit 6 (subunit J)